MKRLLKGFFALVLLFTGTVTVRGQAKKPLDHDVYEIWNRINEHAISDDGDWVLFSLGPEDGDATLRVTGRAATPSYEVARGVSAQFTDDAHYVAFLIKPPREVVRQAKREKKKDDALPKDSLGILDLRTGAVTRIERVKSFALPEDGNGWLAYHLEKPLDGDDSTGVGSEEKPAEAPEKKDQKKEKEKAEGTPLVLRNLASGVETRFPHVTAYLFSKDGHWLVYTASNKDGDADGIVAVATASGAVDTLLAGPGVYTQATFDEDGTQLAFLSNRDDYDADQPGFTLYRWQAGTGSAPEALAAEGTPGIPAGWWVSEHGTLTFSKEGTRLFFGTAPRPEPEDDDETLDEEKVVVDIWNWQDPLLQPMQLEQREAEQKRTYRAVVHLADGRVVQLADEALPEVEVGHEGEADIAVGNTDVPYRQRISWDYPRYFDVYLVDVNTGERRRVLDEVQAQAHLSSNAGYLAWWNRDDLAWYAQAVDGGAPVNLTAEIPYPVYNELHDWPYKPDAYGSAGWLADDAAFLVYDKNDIWAVDPNGVRTPRNLTEGRGRAENLRLRYVKLDPDQQAIDPNAPMLLSAFDLGTKAAGFYRDRAAGARPPERLIMMDRRFSTPEKAEDDDVLLFTRESFEEFPDLWVSGLDFADARRVSHANPQQGDYRWGTVELMTWTSLDGVPLEGLLYKPEGFDATRQYPMMVYFYERNADNLNAHHMPAPLRSIINITFYVSRGYLVFVPDIAYKVGYPGESAMHAVMPGVTALIKQGFVDEAHIGVQGHSWGGYQIAYMVTRTNLFRAAEAGAPVSDMISAYGGIRWGSGMSRMFQYEKTQSRIGGSLWEVPLRYVENSPIFMADKIETPLLIMHNDHDSAVPWYQGIELFVALRRLGKPAWMINYNNEPHWPTTYPNKRDWTIRMQQFFDHYLKDAPAPVWLEEGVPAVMKGKTLGLEPASTTPEAQPAGTDPSRRE